MIRRPPAVVLWGGRPDIDLQAGGRRDRLRQRQLAREAAALRLLERMARAIQPPMFKLGVSAAEAIASMTRTMRALEAAQREEHLRTVRALRARAIRPSPRSVLKAPIS